MGFARDVGNGSSAGEDLKGNPEQAESYRGGERELSSIHGAVKRAVSGGQPRPLSAHKKESCKQLLSVLPKGAAALLRPSSGCNLRAQRGCVSLPGTAGAPHAVNNIPLFPSVTRFMTRQLRSDLGLISTVDAGM